MPGTVWVSVVAAWLRLMLALVPLPALVMVMAVVVVVVLVSTSPSVLVAVVVVRGFVAVVALSSAILSMLHSVIQCAARTCSRDTDPDIVTK